MAKSSRKTRKAARAKGWCSGSGRGVKTVCSALSNPKTWRHLQAQRATGKLDAHLQTIAVSLNVPFSTVKRLAKAKMRAGA